LLPKILIIGGSGLVGSTLTQYALPDYKIHVTLNKNEIGSDRIAVTKIDLLYFTESSTQKDDSAIFPD